MISRRHAYVAIYHALSESTVVARAEDFGA
jgi:hypothetical protein